MPQILLFPSHPPAEVGPPRLAPADQTELADALLRGGSPQTACAALGVEPAAFCLTADADAAFRTRLRHVRDLQTANVVAAVYRAAMQGTPAAQALWLRTFPPPDWNDSVPSAHEPSAEPNDDFEALSDDAIDLQVRAYHAAGGVQ